MNNLITTILGIALAAIVAIVGILYLGTSLPTWQGQAWANAMMSQNQQIIAAANDWSLAHGGDIWQDVGISDLVNQKYLSEWPNLIMLPPQPVTNNINADAYDTNTANNCPAINGYQGQITRMLCTYNGQNMVSFYMKLNDPYNGTCSSQNAGYGYGFEDARYAKHPYVQLALAINKIMGAVPASVTIAGSGLPYLPIGASSPYSCLGKGGITGRINLDASNNPILNYCSLLGTSPASGVYFLACDFAQ